MILPLLDDAPVIMYAVVAYDYVRSSTDIAIGSTSGMLLALPAEPELGELDPMSAVGVDVSVCALTYVVWVYGAW